MQPIEPGRKVTTNESDPDAVNVTGVPGADDVTVHVDKAHNAESISEDTIQRIEKSYQDDHDLSGNSGKVQSVISEDDMDDDFIPSSNDGADVAAGGVIEDDQANTVETSWITGSVIGDIITVILGLLLGYVAFRFAVGYSIWVQLLALIFVVMITILIAYGISRAVRR